MTPERKDDLWLLDMLQAARKALAFTRGKTVDDFIGDDLLQEGVFRLITVIGEAASQVSEERRASIPSIPWRQVVGMRHKLVHHYFRIDAVQVWDVVDNHLLPLAQALETHLSERMPITESHGPSNNDL
jgi:uncharacterized protein with HEPN domain